MTIYKKKLGYPYPFAVLTMGLFILLFGIALLIFSYGFAQFFGLMLMLLAVYMCFLRSEIWIDNENHQVKFVTSLFGLKWGVWELLEHYAAITIKYTLLTDKGYDKVGGGITSIFPMSGRFYNSQYNKQESWRVHLIDKSGEKFLLISGSKQDAIEIINLVIANGKHLKPYLSNYRREFELSIDAIKQEKIVLLSSIK
jgi:hypothetical protein